MELDASYSANVQTLKVTVVCRLADWDSFHNRFASGQAGKSAVGFGKVNPGEEPCPDAAGERDENLGSWYPCFATRGNSFFWLNGDSGGHP